MIKRSEINEIMLKGLKFIEEQKFFLPKFAYWNIKDWKTKGKEIKEIIENQLGWDITDFGSNDFYKTGLLMFTIRNGNFQEKSKYQKPYCEKLLIVEEEQVTPMHHHFSKKEDIINRGGGILQVQVYKCMKQNKLSQDPVTVYIDSIKKEFNAGSVIELKPGDSIYLTPDIYHKFWAKAGEGKILVGEVSSVNNDYIDNQFHDKVNRFTQIIEDTNPLYLLYDDYKNYISIKW